MFISVYVTYTKHEHVTSTSAASLMDLNDFIHSEFMIYFESKMFTNIYLGVNRLLENSLGYDFLFHVDCT